MWWGGNKVVSRSVSQLECEYVCVYPLDGFRKVLFGVYAEFMEAKDREVARAKWYGGGEVLRSLTVYDGERCVVCGDVTC